MNWGRHEGNQRRFLLRTIKSPARFEPTFYDCDFFGREWFIFLRHPIVLVGGNNPPPNFACFQFAAQPLNSRITGCSQSFPRVGPPISFRLLRPVTGDAMLNQQWSDVVLKAGRSTVRERRQENDADQQQQTAHSKWNDSHTTMPNCKAGYERQKQAPQAM